MGKINNKTFIALWLFNPFLSGIYLFRNLKQNTSILPYLLLSFFFGLSFVVSTTGGDSVRYTAELVTYHQQNISLSQVLNQFYEDGNSTLDVYQPLVTWAVSIFTANTKVLFAIFALVFGYFWFKSLLIIRSNIDIPLKGLAGLAFLLLALINPIWNINGVRMWTAVGIFFYGIILLYLQNSKRGWFFLILPMFIHFSLIISLILYLLYRVIPSKNKTALLVLFIFTFFLGELNLDVVREYFELLPGIIQTKQGYLG
ncbi:EpsG family protein, partial [Kaistella sp.]|uniref:EpsG family protein n=1 Tax=Kaistella sp. TaxID=2782235 RepID=UPI003C503145